VNAGYEGHWQMINQRSLLPTFVSCPAEDTARMSEPDHWRHSRERRAYNMGPTPGGKKKSTFRRTLSRWTPPFGNGPHRI